MNIQYKSGAILLIAVCILGVCIFFASSLHFFVSSQRKSTYTFWEKEVAYYLANSGVDVISKELYDLIEKTNKDSSGAFAKKLHLFIEKIGKHSISKLFEPKIKKLVATMKDKFKDNLSINVEVIINSQNFENDKTAWVDPDSRLISISIQSEGMFRGVTKKITVTRRMAYASMILPVVSKFTLHLQDASEGNRGKYNIILNNYNGDSPSTGARPLICINNETNTEEVKKDAYKKRGWIFMGGAPTLLQISSGAGKEGEVFHFYKIPQPGRFITLRFKEKNLPSIFSNSREYISDFVDISKTSQYKFDYNFILEGFHYSSTLSGQNAMYVSNILSPLDYYKYGSKSSFLKLYGTTDQMSPTKVIGNVSAAYIRYAWLSIKPLDPFVYGRFAGPRMPIFFLPSMPGNSYDPSRRIKNFYKDQQHFGEPKINSGNMGLTANDYHRLMSKIEEKPYITSYNMIQDIISENPDREFPPAKEFLKKDSGLKLILKRDDKIIYEAIAKAPKSVKVVSNRALDAIDSIDDFWNKYYIKKDNCIKINGAIKIINLEKKKFSFPPKGFIQPLNIEGKGIIILENGDLELRGCKINSKKDCLSIVAVNGENVIVSSSVKNDISILAPKACLKLDARSEIYGSVAVKTISVDNTPKGGIIRFRESLDPTRVSYKKYMTFYTDDEEGNWYEK